MIKLAMTCKCLPSLSNTLALPGSHQHLIIYSLQTLACVGFTRGKRLCVFTTSRHVFMQIHEYSNLIGPFNFLMICTVL